MYLYPNQTTNNMKKLHLLLAFTLALSTQANAQYGTKPFYYDSVGNVIYYEDTLPKQPVDNRVLYVRDTIEVLQLDSVGNILPPHYYIYTDTIIPSCTHTPPHRIKVEREIATLSYWKKRQRWDRRSWYIFAAGLAVMYFIMK